MFDLNRLREISSRAGSASEKAAGIVAGTRENVAAIQGDATRSEAWKADRLSEIRESAGRSLAAVVPLSREDAEAVDLEMAALSDPTMMLSRQPVAGTKLDSIEDLAARAEFRALMGNATPAVREAWFNQLASRQDWGRLGVLLSMSPELREKATDLPIPGREEAIGLLSTIRKHESTCHSAFTQLRAAADPGNQRAALAAAVSDLASGWFK